ncbi:MAG TPA: TonB-dependent receptor [Candidatus Angelobacter sp.]|jgi:outer membrane cobalamin receptor|nr:TonB-dependent receptor [Candidatus Angelobacter sp.]
MRNLGYCVVVLFFALLGTVSRATIFGSVRGVIHDSQHRPVPGASVTLKSATSDWTKSTQTDQDGAFFFNTVPVGDYAVTVSQAGFANSQQKVTVAAESSPVLHFQLQIGSINQTATVTAEATVTNVDSSSPTTLLSREDVAQTPGADRTNSLQIITDYVPGAYYTHDQLHIRGGHQVSWLIDGVPVPNSNIASNVGPQFDPKDIDYMEVLRGSYSAEYGDRTYGVFNVVPRSGFERNNEGELVLSAGNFGQTNDQVSFGGHTSRFAYYASLNGNRSDLGLQTPIGQIFHDAENGYGGFGSLMFNATPKDQLRLVTSLRRDYYQVPFDPNPNDSENQQFDTSGLRDGQHEADAFVNFSWVHTINANSVLTVSPFYHYNSANYDGAPNDTPISTGEDRTSTYAGGQASFNSNFARNNFYVGVYGYQQHDDEVFRILFNDDSVNANFRDTESPSGGVVSAFIDDRFKVTSWLTLMAGMRPTHFSGGVTEDTINPRFGVAFEVPHLKWVFRAFYGHYYQAPPLITASGPLLQFVTSQNFGFLALHGERDEESQFGVTIPYRGWALEIDTFKTRVNNFFDHNNVGESNIFFPLTIDGALIRAWEVTVRSPRLWHRGQMHLAYSNQVALARGAITGGLTDFSLPSGFSPLDHDQRNTLNVGFNAALPWRAFASSNVSYGSGFTNGSPNAQFPGSNLPQHTTFDLTLAKSFGENYSLSVTALNVANRHLLIDNSVTFGGFHFNDPRELYAEFRWHFHY